MPMERELNELRRGGKPSKRRDQIIDRIEAALREADEIACRAVMCAEIERRVYAAAMTRSARWYRQLSAQIGDLRTLKTSPADFRRAVSRLGLE